MKDYIERMCDESNELSAQISTIAERATKLEAFMASNPYFETMSPEAQQMQREQWKAMDDARVALLIYQTWVDKRIAYELNK